MAEPISFKFRHVDENGNEVGFFSSKKGSFDDETLVLDKERIDADAIVRAVIRGGRLVIVMPGEKEDDQRVIVLAVYGKKAKPLMLAINRIASMHHAARRQVELEEKDKAHLVRFAECPHCGCMIDACGHPETPQIYCDYCDSFATLDGSGPPDESKYHHCDQCGLYSQPKQFTIFYFVFLFVFYYFSSRSVHCCNACMRKEAWKMFFGNLLFLLGLPTAITQLIRAYRGGSNLSPAFKGLDSANAALAAGRLDRAASMYETIEQRGFACAGVRHSHGVALGGNRDFEQAAMQFELALGDCSNYAESARLLAASYQELGRDDEVKAVLAEWNDGDIVATETDADPDDEMVRP